MSGAGHHRYRLEAMANGVDILRNALRMLRRPGESSRIYGYRLFARRAFALYWKAAPGVQVVPGYLRPEDLAPVILSWLAEVHTSDRETFAPCCPEAVDTLTAGNLGWHLRADEVNGVPDFDAFAFAVIVPAYLPSTVLIRFMPATRHPTESATPHLAADSIA